MYMLHYDPFREIRRFHDHRNRRSGGFGSFGDDAGRWQLPLDVLERDDGVVVTASVPGIKPEDLEVTLEYNVLTINGKTEFAEDTKDERFIIRERRSGAFQRSIRLPESVNADEAVTHYEHGVLSVTLPKAEEKKARRLEVGTPTA